MHYAMNFLMLLGVSAYNIELWSTYNVHAQISVNWAVWCQAVLVYNAGGIQLYMYVIVCI